MHPEERVYRHVRSEYIGPQERRLYKPETKRGAEKSELVGPEESGNIVLKTLGVCSPLWGSYQL